MLNRGKRYVVSKNSRTYLYWTMLMYWSLEEGQLGLLRQKQRGVQVKTLGLLKSMDFVEVPRLPAYLAPSVACLWQPMIKMQNLSKLYLALLNVFAKHLLQKEGSRVHKYTAKPSQ